MAICADISVSAISSAGASDVRAQYTNGTSNDMKLIKMQLGWPASGSRRFIGVNFSGSSIWTGNASVSPFSINPNDWTSASRILPASGSRIVQSIFNFAVAGTGTYTVKTFWENQFTGASCQASTVLVNP